MPAAQPAMKPRTPWWSAWPATAPAAPYLRQPPGRACAVGAAMTVAATIPAAMSEDINDLCI